MLEDRRFNLLVSEETPAEIYPYRRVWRAVAIEIGAMVFLVFLVIVGTRLGFLRDVASRNWGLLLILVPLGTYLWFSVRGEQQALEPREGLLTVTLFSALLANGLGLPLVNGFFEPREWLADAPFFTRLFGYSFTLGVTSEFLKYVAIRYTIWPKRIRTRIDGVAYSVAASVGYATVLNGHLVFGNEPTVSAEAIRIAINFISQLSFGVIMGYFMAEMALVPNRAPFFLAGGLFAGSLVQGAFVAFRGIAAGSGFRVASINGLLLVIFFAFMVTTAINFLVENAESRAADLAGVKRIR